MKLESAKLIVASAEEMGVELSLYESYSGRAMYGKKTAGICFSNIGDIIAAAANVAINLSEAEREYYEENDTGKPLGLTSDEFINDLSSVSTDSMGRDLIIY